ncbi:MAG: thermonuclease family protein [Pirellula sp.]|nr:thermonuclease family protein [Pirellula sp.]
MNFQFQRVSLRIPRVGLCLILASTFGMVTLFSPDADAWGQEVSKAVGSEPKTTEPKDEEPKEEEMVGIVEKVIDGDSFKIREDGGDLVHEIQVEGTDAPELKQPYGKESAEALRKLILDRKVRITWTKKDNFGRRLAQVFAEDVSINHRMIRDGHAWHFKRYNQSKVLAELEEEARKDRRGLWGTENPQAPWDYRKENRAPDKPDR